jgi:CelD/BcsL family acetyltransferase involved in cellulose biosynthesis
MHVTDRVDVARVVRPAALSEPDLHHWRGLQASHPELDRPFFAPEWFRALDDAGHDVEVAVLATDGRERGYFPFHRRGSVALPPGGRLCDFQGWIGPADLPLDMEATLRAIGARSWRFNHLLARQEAAARFATDRAESPLADLGDGFEAFLAAHRAKGAGWVSQVPRKARKLGREVGELRFEHTTSDPAVLERLREWKRAQRERTRTVDPLDEDWAARAIERCLATDGPDFAGMLSALYAGDELVAAHVGLRSRGTFHIWFPAYDTAHEAYSPGLVLMYEMFRAVAEEGVRRVDFGKGPERYKSSWMTGSEPLGEGFIDLRPISRLVGGAAAAGRRAVRGSGAAPVLRGSRRRLRELTRRLRRGG